MKYRDLEIEIKDIGESDGTFVGLASVYGNEDLGGDIVVPGAFQKTLQDRGGEVPLLWQHNMREPIGIGKLADTPKGLEIQGKLVLSVARAKEAYDLLKNRVIKGLSIGYDTVRDEIKDKKRLLKELKLWEVSVVTFPMNELANVQSVKSEDVLARLEALEHALKVLAPESLRAGKPPADSSAATQDEIAPEVLHPISRIEKLLRGEI
jgi:hypothetical protein